jgi:hypothetical protein
VRTLHTRVRARVSPSTLNLFMHRTEQQRCTGGALMATIETRKNAAGKVTSYRVEWYDAGLGADISD